jgi:hypothetical protein
VAEEEQEEAAAIVSLPQMERWPELPCSNRAKTSEKEVLCRLEVGSHPQIPIIRDREPWHCHLALRENTSCKILRTLKLKQ